MVQVCAFKIYLMKVYWSNLKAIKGVHLSFSSPVTVPYAHQFYNKRIAFNKMIGYRSSKFADVV